GEANVQQGAGTVRAQKLATAGPNGGPVYRLEVTATGTAGNNRALVIYPSGTSQNTQTVIVHHVQHETGAVATSPIVTTTAAVTRAADMLTFPWPHGVISMAVCEAGIEAGLRALMTARAWQIGSGTSTSLQRSLQLSMGSTMLAMSLGNGSAAVSSLAAPPPLGAEYQRLALLEVTGTQARVRLLQRYRATPGGGSWTDASAAWSNPLDVTPLLREGWQANTLTIGNVAGGNRPGRLILSDFFVLRGADWTMDQIREVVGV